AIASVLIGLLGEIGTVILCIGVGAILLVFIFGIKPAEMIADFIDNRREEKEERRAEREEARLARIKEKEENEVVRKETKKERRLREKEEQRREAEELAEQLTINLNDASEDDNGKNKKLKKYDHKDDDIIPFSIG